VRRVRIIEGAAEFPQIKTLWEELFASSALQPTVFQSYAWNEIAARLFAERERPHVVVVESDSGAAIIPACVRRESVSLLGEELFDYRDVIAAGDEALLDVAWQKISDGSPFEVKAVRGRRAWAEMKRFAGAPYLAAAVPLKHNKALERNLRLLLANGCVLQAQGLKPKPLLNTFHPAEAGCPRGNATVSVGDDAQRSHADETGILPPRPTRGEDDKPSVGDRLAEALPLDCASLAAAAALGVTDGSGHRVIGPSGHQAQIPRRCAPRNDKGNICDLVRWMYQLKARQENGSLFRDPVRIEAVLKMAASAETELFTLEREGDLVAAVLTFLDGNVCRFYGTYYDEQWARYSPGVSLLYRVIQQAQARRLDFDFMTGEQAYKLRFASEVVPLYIASKPAAAKLAA